MADMYLGNCRTQWAAVVLWPELAFSQWLPKLNTDWLKVFLESDVSPPVIESSCAPFASLKDRSPLPLGLIRRPACGALEQQR